MEISYKKSSNNFCCIYDHLQKVNSLFTPSLDLRVDLKEYADKLNDKAINLEAWHSDILIGLLSYYLNEQLNEVFVTNVSVLKEFQGAGIASELLNKMFEDNDVKSKSKIRLFASSKDEKLLNFYKKRGFYLGCKSGDQNEMIYRINDVIPMVSICCVTYNHEQYIRQCLDGLLMQKTNFPIEVLIHDDASTDYTADIIREYEEKFPEIIKPIYQTDNQFSKGFPISYTYNWPRAKGKYIAMCEGDDYWTDPYKLQKQVDFLDRNLDYTMCFHEAIVHWENNEHEDRIFAHLDNKEYSDVDIYEKWIVATSSVLFKTKIINSEDFILNINNKKFIYGDIILFLNAAKHGKVFGMSDVMSVYRRHPGGMVYNNNGDEDREKRYIHNRAIGQVFKGRLRMASNKICTRLCVHYSSDYFHKKNYPLFFHYLYLGLSSNPILFFKLFIGSEVKKWVKRSISK